MIGSRMLRMSTRVLPSADSTRGAQLVATKRLRRSTPISSLFMRKCPPHHFSKLEEPVALVRPSSRGCRALSRGVRDRGAQIVDEVGAVELAVARSPASDASRSRREPACVAHGVLPATPPIHTGEPRGGSGRQVARASEHSSAPSRPEFP